ncbi:hypothetical protein M5E87_03185 [Flavonifractor plautii]|nr:hypothetical protein M5E87_03185 [Flavonifractor plautii]
MQPPLWPQLLLQVILIAINAYFAATEIAVISLNEAVIRHQAEEGDKRPPVSCVLWSNPPGFSPPSRSASPWRAFWAPPSPPTTW